MSLSLGQYAYTVTLTNGNVEYPVHVDMPTHAQKVFRGTADRFVDMIIQAKAHIEART